MQTHITRLGAVLALLTVGHSPAAATVPPSMDGVAAENPGPGDEQPDRRRLLRLDDGSVRRVRSRRRAGVWEVRNGREWEALPGRVVEQRLEREAVAEARRRSAQARGADARVQVAGWMAEQGLTVEAIRLLDQVLGEDGDQPAALALVATGRLRLDLKLDRPELTAKHLKACLSAGASGSPAEREVAVVELAGFSQRTDLRRLLEIELNHPRPTHRAFAVLAIRRLFDGEFVTQLVERSLWDTYETVRHTAARALAGTPESPPLAPIVEALAHDHSVVRLHAIEAMSLMGYAAAVEPLVVHLSLLQNSDAPSMGTRANLFVGRQQAIVRDFDVEIAQGQSIADPIVGVVDSGVILDVRALAQITRADETRAVTKALRRLTGRSRQAEPQAWIDWWEDEQKRPGNLKPEGRSRNILSKDE